MISIDLTKQTQADNYKLLTGSVVPRPIAFVTSLSKTGVLNAAPFSYFNIVSSDPPLVSVSVERKLGEQKHTAQNILHGKQFVIHIVDGENVKQVNEASANLSAAESEVNLANLTRVDSEKVSVPGVQEAKIRLECQLKQVVNLSDTGNGCDLIIGKVVQMHIAKSVYEEGKINISALKPVSRLAGENYATIGETFAIKRPK